MKDELIRRMARLKAVAREVETGASKVEVVDTPHGDGRVRVEAGAHGSIEFLDDSGETGIRATRYPASTARPSGYPADLPFPPNRPCSVMVLPEKRRRILSWTSADGPKTAIAELDSAADDLGWRQRSRQGWFFGLFGEASEHERGSAALSISAYRFPGGATKVRVVADSSSAVSDAA